MQRKSLSSPKNEKELNLVTEIIKSGRYFNEISLSYLKEMLRQGELVSLNADEYLIREDHPKPPEVKSDGPNMLKLSQLPELLKQIKTLDSAVRSQT